MAMKFSSIVMILLVFFIAKISIESVSAAKRSDQISDNERSPASIDRSYQEHLNQR
jgi:hypothetical protein